MIYYESWYIVDSYGKNCVVDQRSNIHSNYIKPRQKIGKSNPDGGINHCFIFLGDFYCFSVMNDVPWCTLMYRRHESRLRLLDVGDPRLQHVEATLKHAVLSDGRHLAVPKIGPDTKIHHAPPQKYQEYHRNTIRDHQAWPAGMAGISTMGT